MAEQKTAPEAPKATTPAPQEVAFDLVKKDTKTELEAIKKELGVTEENKKDNEWEKMEAFLTANKEKIKTVTKGELEELRKDINDKNNALSIKLDEKADNEIKYVENIPDGTTPSPETPQEPVEKPVNIAEITSQVPPEYQKEVKNYVVDNGGVVGTVSNWLSNKIAEIIKGIKGFFATFGIEDEGEKKDKLAQINGFEDAEEERRVTASVKALKSSPVTKGPPLSDILKISHISNEDLTKILKDNPGLDFSSNKNMEAAFTGSYLPSEKEPMTRYLRIYTVLGRIHKNPPEIYNPKDIFTRLLSGSSDTTLVVPDAPINNTTVVPGMTPSTQRPENAPTSPEEQRDLLGKAQEIDKLPTSTDGEKKTKEEQLKKFQEERVTSIITKYKDLEKRINDAEKAKKLLEVAKSPEESEKNKLAEAIKTLLKLTTIKTQMETEMEKVMILKENKWEIKTDATAESIILAEIAINNMEKNDAIMEMKNMTEKEKQEQFALQEIEEATKKFVCKEMNNEDDKDTNSNYLCDKVDVIKSGREIVKNLETKKDNSDILKEKIASLKKIIAYSEAKTRLVNQVNNILIGEEKSWNTIGNYRAKTDNTAKLESPNSGWVVTGVYNNGIWIDIDNTITDKCIMKEGYLNGFNETYIATLTNTDKPNKKWETLRKIIIANKDRIDNGTVVNLD